jgi:Protein of unknown function (DUF3667)
MSHSPERKEKNCLNCGTTVLGKYCQVCGQENIEPKESFFSIVTHFFNDITHFDGKFFTSLKDLLFKPGFLSAEYIKGRRASYLHPIRMYVFTSAIFFLVFFSLTSSENALSFAGNEPFTLAQRDSIIKSYSPELAGKDSALYKKQLLLLQDTASVVRPDDLLMSSSNFQVIGTFSNRTYNDSKEYDSVQSVLPAAEKDGWLKRLWNKKAVSINEKYKGKRRESIKSLGDSFLHKLPYLLFVSLPFFALILRLLYVRRKEFYYADHGIFSIHHYVFSFILLLFVFLLDKLNDISHWAIWKILIAVSIFVWPVYLFLAMKRFYKQGGFKTFIKFLSLNILGLLVLGLLLVFFTLFSIFQL